MQLHIESKTVTSIAFWLVTLATIFFILFIIAFTPLAVIQKYALIVSVLFADAVTLSFYYRLAAKNRSVRFSDSKSEEMALFVELFQNSPVPYIRATSRGVIIDANAAAVRLFGETAEALKQRNLFTALSAEEKNAAHVAMIPDLVENGSFVNDQEALFTRSDGEVRWVMVSAFPYARKSETLVTLIDITKQKNIDTAKSEFVSLASHQLRTPIASIKWNIELLASAHIGTLTAPQKEYVDKIGRSAERMSLLVKDFLDASQLEMGTFATEVSQISLTDFLDEQLEEFDVKVQTKNLTIERVYPNDSLTFEVDAHLLRMSTNNLISNAVKYTPDGGRIRISYVRSGDTVEIRVRDTGFGIPEADQPRLFSKFFRSENVKQTLIEGTGVGLYIVRQAVKMMNGAISFASKEGVGTEFLIVLPFRE